MQEEETETPEVEAAEQADINYPYTVPTKTNVGLGIGE